MSIWHQGSSWGAAQLPGYLGVQAGEILVGARTLLNDDEAIIWPDQKLYPKLLLAHRMLQMELLQNGVPVTSATSTVLLIPAGTTDITTLSTWPPPNFASPIWMKERMSGQTNQDFVDMTEVDFLPNLNPSTELIWWAWNGQKILFLGANQDREVQLRYRAWMNVPWEATEPSGAWWGEVYLAFKTAAFAVGSIVPRDGDKLMYLEGQAAVAINNLLVTAALESQNLPTKRRPYHRGRGRSRVLRDF